MLHLLHQFELLYYLFMLLYFAAPARAAVISIKAVLLLASAGAALTFAEAFVIAASI